MKKYLLTICLTVASALSFTSCLSDTNTENTYKAILGSNESFARVLDTETMETITTSGAAYSLTFNNTKSTLTFEVSGLLLASNYGGLSFHVPSLPLQVNAKTGFVFAEGKDIIPTGTQGSYVFNDLSVNVLLNRSYENVSHPVYLINYTINDRYKVTVYQKDNYYFCTTPSSTTANREVMCYNVSIDPIKNTAILRVYNGKFTTNMMTTTFAIKDIPVEFTSNGYILRTTPGEELKVIDTSNREVEGWSASDINITAVLNGKVTINFNCDLGDQGKHSVYNTADYLIYETDL